MKYHYLTKMHGDDQNKLIVLALTLVNVLYLINKIICKLNFKNHYIFMFLISSFVALFIRFREMFINYYIKKSLASELNVLTHVQLINKMVALIIKSVKLSYVDLVQPKL